VHKILHGHSRIELEGTPESAVYNSRALSNTPSNFTTRTVWIASNQRREHVRDQQA
jgi:hypothetical protein